MWIFLNDAFLSIVEPALFDRVDPKHWLKVRARFRGDIQKVFPDVKVSCTPRSDYRYRAFVARDVVGLTICKALVGVNYSNFKDSVLDDERHALYARIWGEAHWAQMQAHKPKAKGKMKSLVKP